MSSVGHDFDSAWPFFNGYAIIKKNGKYGYINTSGKIVIAPQYPSSNTTEAIGIIGCFGSVYEGLAVIRDFDKQRGMCDPFVIDMSNNIIIKPQKHERMGIGFSEGLLVAENEPNKAGFIDISGEFVIEPKFYIADAFHEGLARVLMHNSKYGFINKQGDMVIKARYTEAEDFNEGLAQVIINGKAGFIDKQGNIVIEPKFEAACNFKYGLAYIWEGDKTGYINRQGEFVWKPTK